MLLMLDYELTLYRSTWLKVTAPSLRPWVSPIVSAIRQFVPSALYLPWITVPLCSCPFPNFSPFEAQHQSEIESAISPLINRSLQATPAVFVSPDAVVATILTPRLSPSPNTSFLELPVHPHHFRRSSFSTVPIRVAEIARLRKVFWDMQIAKLYIYIEEDTVEDDESRYGETSKR
jgi:hypothetical protein